MAALMSCYGNCSYRILTVCSIRKIDSLILRIIVVSHVPAGMLDRNAINLIGTEHLPDTGIRIFSACGTYVTVLLNESVKPSLNDEAPYHQSNGKQIKQSAVITQIIKPVHSKPPEITLFRKISYRIHFIIFSKNGIALLLPHAVN